MRRRERPIEQPPPAHLLAYDPAHWLPLVDERDYDPDQHRNIADGVCVGAPRTTREAWRAAQAVHLWSAARLEWSRDHGWPGKGVVELLRETVQVRRDVLTRARDVRSL